MVGIEIINLRICICELYIFCSSDDLCKNGNNYNILKIFFKKTFSVRFFIRLWILFSNISQAWETLHWIINQSDYSHSSTNSHTYYSRLFALTYFTYCESEWRVNSLIYRCGYFTRVRIASSIINNIKTSLLFLI